MGTLVYGFHDLEGMKEQRIQEIGISETNMRIMEWQAEINRQKMDLERLFARRNPMWNNMPITRYQTPAASRGQYGDEYMIAKPEKEEGYHEVGLPLWRYEFAFAATYEAIQKMTVGELNRELLRVERGDANEQMNLILFALFYDTNWTFTSTESNLPNIPVKALANGEANVTWTVRGSDTPQTADHYLAQAGDIVDASDPYPVARELLTRYATAGNSDRIIHFVGGADNVTKTRALTDFYDRKYTTFVNYGDDVSLVDASADAYSFMGLDIVGEHGSGGLVVRWQRIPANYIVSVNIDVEPALGIREDPVPALQGLFNIDAIEDSGNTLLRRFRRKIGYAPVNRTAVAITRVNNGTYAAPAPYNVIP